MQWITKNGAAAMVAATLAFTPALANAQQPGAPQPSSGNDRQEAIRSSLTAAQASLSEMIKLPEAAKLQGDVRTSVSDFIAKFNEFATLPKDWKVKYTATSETLDKMLVDAAAAPAPEAPAAPAPGAAPAAPADPNAAGPGVWEPAVVAKLKDVRTHLDAFEKATGDPLFVVWDIEDLLKASGADSGTATLDATKLATLNELLTKIKVAAGGQ